MLARRSMTEQLRDRECLLNCRRWTFETGRRTTTDAGLLQESRWRFRCDARGWPAPKYSAVLDICRDTIPTQNADRCGSAELLTRWGDEEIAEEGNVIAIDLSMAADVFDSLAVHLTRDGVRPSIHIVFAEPLADGRWPVGRKIRIAEYKIGFAGAPGESADTPCKDPK